MPKGVLSWRHCKKLRHNVAQRIGRQLFLLMQCTLAAHCTTLANSRLGGYLAGGYVDIFVVRNFKNAATSVLRLVAPSIDIDDDVGGLI